MADWMTMTDSENFLQQLAGFGGYWKYDNKRYLAKLTSGKISDEFFNLTMLTQVPSTLDKWCHVIADIFIKRFFGSSKLESPIGSGIVVVGPGMGAITMAFSVSRHIGDSKAFFTEPHETTEPIINGVVSKKCQKLKRFTIPENVTVFLVEDVITTGGSVQATLNALDAAGVKFNLAPIVGCLVDRRIEKGPINLSVRMVPDPSCPYHIVPAEVISIVSTTPRTWDTLEEARKVCPQAEGALRPKENWQRLVEG